MTQPDTLPIMAGPGARQATIAGPDLGMPIDGPSLRPFRATGQGEVER